ncbi:copper oxidase [Loktanella sp. 22II-4b]|nr:copper oxidase [Loktanella sp. 22II-4b]
MRAGLAKAQLTPAEYPATEVWAYNGTAPGPTLRIKRGALLRQRLVNGLPEATSIHWHGLRLPNAMDGVPGLTQEAVGPGESFDYEFTVPDAGTFWYHTHNRSWEQMARGLYGPLIIDEETPPDVDRDLILTLDDWRLDQTTAAIAGGFDGLHDQAHGGRIGNLVTVNGQFDHRQPVRGGERLRLRLINTANARIFNLGLQGLEGWVVALDGQPLEKPEPAAEVFRLAPAQRIDLIVDVTAEPGEEAYLVGLERDGGFALATFEAGSEAAQARRPAPEALAPNDLPAPDLKGAREVPMLLEGGAMRGLAKAEYLGREMSGRELAEQGQVWALNGVAGMPAAPFAGVGRGETLRIPMRNDTMFPHAMHLHGHHFRQEHEDGTLGPWRDTILVDPDQVVTIVFAADNPGRWLFHCHMLGHQVAGMKTRIEVAS